MNLSDIDGEERCSISLSGERMRTIQGEITFILLKDQAREKNVIKNMLEFSVEGKNMEK